jgi:carboxylesterase type B
MSLSGAVLFNFGNPQSITAFRESAGSMSLAYHIYSSIPLFKRVVLQSGTASSANLASLEERGTVFSAVEILQY